MDIFLQAPRPAARSSRGGSCRQPGALWALPPPVTRCMCSSLRKPMHPAASSRYRRHLSPHVCACQRSPRKRCRATHMQDCSSSPMKRIGSFWSHSCAKQTPLSWPLPPGGYWLHQHQFSMPPCLYMFGFIAIFTKDWMCGPSTLDAYF